VRQVTGIQINPSSATITKGSTQQFLAEVYGNANPPQSVVWTVTGGFYTTNIDPEGLLTVSSVEMAPSLIVTATSTYDTSKSRTATVTVTEPSSSPNIMVLFGYEFNMWTGQNDYYATVTAITAESWNPTMVLSVGGNTLTLIHSDYYLENGHYINRWTFECSEYVPGSSYAVTLTVDGTTTSSILTINQIAVIDMTNFPNPYNPMIETTLNWTIDLPAGTNPDEQVIIGSYHVNYTPQVLEMYPAPTDRSYILLADLIAPGASGIFSLEILTYYFTTIPNSSVTFAYFTTSDPMFVWFDSVIANPPPIPQPTINYHKILNLQR